MEEIILVQTGEVKSGRPDAILKSSPLGSCVVVVLFDKEVKSGAMAHIMLPGCAPDKKYDLPTKYAANAVEELLKHMSAFRANRKRLKAVIAGGGNVLKREGDTIGADVLKDVVIIAQTAYALSGDRKKALEAGCDEYIAKPVNKEKLLGLINKTLMDKTNIY